MVKNSWSLFRKCGFLPTFGRALVDFWRNFSNFTDDFDRKNGQLPTFCPLFKTKMATKNPVFMRVCGFFAHFPTFFLI